MTLRLLPDRDPSAAAEELRRQESAVGNVRTTGHTGRPLLREYLKWALQAETMLRNHFTSDTVSSLVFTRRYWALQAAGAMTGPDGDWELVQPLVNAEISEQQSRLLAEKALLDDAASRWRWGTLLVLDTSALIHGPAVWEWDPAADLGLDTDNVQMVLPMLVLDELDDLKESAKQHTRSRARRTLKWLSEQLGSGDFIVVSKGRPADYARGISSRGEVHLEVLVDEPGHQRLNIADDEIVDRASAIASASGRTVTLVTNDVGQAYRARLAGLEVATVSEPIYDIDLQEQAAATAKEKKRQDAVERRAAQEAQRGKRKGQDGEPGDQA